MAIESAVSTVSATAAANVNSNMNINKTQTQKTGNESFKDEMEKVKESDVKETEKTKESDKTEKIDKNDKKVEDKKDDSKKDDKSVKNKKDMQQDTAVNQNNTNETGIVAGKISINEINNNLSNDIYQMMNTNMVTSNAFWGLSSGDKSTPSALSVNEADANFFIDLTQTNNISMANITAQAQMMVDNGADAEQVQKSTQVSKALIDALSNAREKNQPVRVDFDKNISVVLRVSHNGTIAAHFIPGDKAVEQYLRNNIETLKNTFDENNLPYSDLSYSHSGREQNRRRREERQGE